MRRDPRLRERWRAQAAYVGLLLSVVGVVQATPLLGLLAFPEELSLAPAFALPALAAGAAGYALWRRLRPARPPALSVAEGGVVLLAAWTVATASSAVPFVWVLGLDGTRAVFESVSGWTTTGLSVVDVESAPRLVLLWRSVMQLAGGAGMAIALLAVGGGPLGPGLATAEGRGDQLVPNVRRSAKLVAVIYAGYVVLGVLSYAAAGMSAFDAVNHAFAAVSTGGFATHPASLGHWDSLPLELVTCGLMALGSTNFQLAYVLMRGRVRPFLQSVELRTGFVLFAAATALVAWQLAARPDLGAGRALRYAVFEVASALTTTGFSTTAYGGWPLLATMTLVLVMVVGGQTGSTAGGVKQFRAFLLVRTLAWEVGRLVRPPRAVAVHEIWHGGERRRVGRAELADLAGMLTLYLCTLLLCSGVLIAHGFGLTESLFETVSALSTVGLSVGVTSASAPSGVLWALSASMLLGRLEFLIVLVGLVKLSRDAAELWRAPSPSAG